jgi:hypothetical protein
MTHDDRGFPLDTAGGWSQLHMAAWRGDADVISEIALLALATTTPIASANATAVRSPAAGGVGVASADRAAALLAETNEVEVSAFPRLLASRILDMASLDGTTALHLAAEAGQSGCVRLLLQAGADPNVSTQVSSE